MTSLEEFKKTFEREKEEILQDYFTFLRFPSISTDPAYRPQVLDCAAWLVTYLSKMGLTVETWKTKGAPAVFATWKVDPKAPTLLLYCHYDVQPVDPLELWTTPPFEPTLKGEDVFARGAADNKGQCFYTIRALKTLIEKKALNVNLKFLIEGEEESGSTGLHGILQERKKELAADHILIVDSGIEKKGVPAITLGARGIVTFTVRLKGSKFDLHSGTHGGIVYNPNHALVELLAALHDAKGKVAIPHFYDAVSPITEEEKKELSLHFDEKHLASHFGAQPTGGEKDYSPLESAWLRPTLEINGISGGYSGAGFKTVIPSVALAKLSCRLVPNQDPEKIGNLVKEFLLAKAPPGIEVDVEIMQGKGKAYRANPHSKIALTMNQAYSEVFKKECHKIMIGGSIPIAADLAAASGGEMLLVGVGLSEDQIHAPNEHFGLDRFEQGYLALCRGIELLGQ